MNCDNCGHDKIKRIVYESGLTPDRQCENCKMVF